MLTKIKNTNKEKNDLETNHSFSIPKNIQNDINEKGFSLYNWIGEQDFKNSLKNDFFNILNYIGTFFGIIIITYGIIYFYSGGLIEEFGLQNYSNIPNLVYLIILLLFFTIIIGYIGIKSIQKSALYLKNHYVLLTNKYISINGKIYLLNDINIFFNDINKIGKIFNETLFKKSQLNRKNESLKKKMKKKISDGYKFITKSINNKSNPRKSSGLIGIIILIFYTGYIGLIWFIYYIGLFLISIFGILLSIINKQILLKTGHKITTINDKFENIDKNSKELIKEKDSLGILLSDAMKNDWKDSLLTKINSGIKNINKNASNAVDTSIELKKEIKKSKYKEMFNFSIYNSWIKKQIYIPLKQILDLLQKNLDKLKENENNIELEIQKTNDESFKGPLVATKVRTQMRIKDIEKHIKGIEIYINKLK